MEDQLYGDFLEGLSINEKKEPYQFLAGKAVVTWVDERLSEYLFEIPTDLDKKEYTNSFIFREDFKFTRHIEAGRRDDGKIAHEADMYGICQKHPNILHMIHYNENFYGVPMLVLDNIDGQLLGMSSFVESEVIGTLHRATGNTKNTEALQKFDWFVIAQDIFRGLHYMHGLNISHNNITEQSIVYRDLGGKRTYMIADFSEAKENSEVDRSIDFKAAARVVLWAAETIDADLQNYRFGFQNTLIDQLNKRPVDSNNQKTKDNIKLSLKQRFLFKYCFDVYYTTTVFPSDFPQQSLILVNTNQNTLYEKLLVLLEITRPSEEWERNLFDIEHTIGKLHDTLVGQAGLLASGLYLFATDSALHKSITDLYMALSNAQMHPKYFKQSRPSVFNTAQKLLMSLIGSKTISFGLAGILTPWAIRHQCLLRLYNARVQYPYDTNKLKNPSLSIQYI